MAQLRWILILQMSSCILGAPNRKSDFLAFRNRKSFNNQVTSSTQSASDVNTEVINDEDLQGNANEIDNLLQFEFGQRLVKKTRKEHTNVNTDDDAVHQKSFRRATAQSPTSPQQRNKALRKAGRRTPPSDGGFRYSVMNSNSQQVFGHQATYDPSGHRGSYFVHFADGRVLLVTYTADHRGYRPFLRYFQSREDLDDFLSNTIEEDNTAMSPYSTLASNSRVTASPTRKSTIKPSTAKPKDKVPITEAGVSLSSSSTTAASSSVSDTGEEKYTTSYPSLYPSSTKKEGEQASTGVPGILVPTQLVPCAANTSGCQDQSSPDSESTTKSFPDSSSPDSESLPGFVEDSSTIHPFHPTTVLNTEPVTLSVSDLTTAKITPTLPITTLSPTLSEDKTPGVAATTFTPEDTTKIYDINANLFTEFAQAEVTKTIPGSTASGDTPLPDFPGGEDITTVTSKTNLEASPDKGNNDITNIPDYLTDVTLIPDSVQIRENTTDHFLNEGIFTEIYSDVGSQTLSNEDVEENTTEHLIGHIPAVNQVNDAEEDPFKGSTVGTDAPEEFSTFLTFISPGDDSSTHSATGETASEFSTESSTNVYDNFLVFSEISDGTDVENDLSPENTKRPTTETESNTEYVNTDDQVTGVTLASVLPTTEQTVTFPENDFNNDDKRTSERTLTSAVIDSHENVTATDNPFNSPTENGQETYTSEYLVFPSDGTGEGDLSPGTESVPEMKNNDSLDNSGNSETQKNNDFIHSVSPQELGESVTVITEAENQIHEDQLVNISSPPSAEEQIVYQKALMKQLSQGQSDRSLEYSKLFVSVPKLSTSQSAILPRSDFFQIPETMPIIQHGSRKPEFKTMEVFPSDDPRSLVSSLPFSSHIKNPLPSLLTDTHSLSQTQENTQHNPKGVVANHPEKQKILTSLEHTAEPKGNSFQRHKSRGQTVVVGRLLRLFPRRRPNSVTAKLRPSLSLPSKDHSKGQPTSTLNARRSRTRLLARKPKFSGRTSTTYDSDRNDRLYQHWLARRRRT